MTRTATTTDRPAVPSLRLSASHEKLAAAVLASPRLLSAIPADELDPLFIAHAGATKAATAARRLPAPESANVAAKVEADLLAGRDVDPAELVEKMAAATVATADRDRAVALLNTMPSSFASRIVQTVNAWEDELYVALGDALDELLDRAEPIVFELAGITTADDAIGAGKVAEWTTLRDLAAEHGSLRLDHGKMLRAADVSNFHVGSPALAWAYFAGLDDVAPTFLAEARNESHDLMGRPTTRAPFPVLAVDDPAHFRAVVERRAQLRPVVRTADEALAAYNEAGLRLAAGTSTARQLDAGPVTSWHGGEARAMAHTFGPTNGRPGGRPGEIVYGPPA